MHLHKHDQQTFGEKRTFALPQKKRAQTVIPSQGPAGFVRLMQTLYFRGNRNAGLMRTPELVNDYLIERIELRRQRVQRVRYALAIVAGVVVGVVVWAWVF